ESGLPAKSVDSGADLRYFSSRRHFCHKTKKENAMASNRGVAYIKPGEVRIQSIDFPKLVNPTNKKKAEHGVILKIISTNICGSDQHMVRGRTTAPAGLVLGHEITGEIIEKGRDVETLEVGDIVSVPFNIACGRCRN